MIESGFAGDGAVDGAAAAVAAVVAEEYLAGLADGDLRFKGDCDGDLWSDWTFGVKYDGRLFIAGDPAGGLVRAGEVLGRRLLHRPPAGALASAAYRGTWFSSAISSPQGGWVYVGLQGPSRRSRLTTSKTWASSLSVWPVSETCRTTLGGMVIPVVVDAPAAAVDDDGDPTVLSLLML